MSKSFDWQRGEESEFSRRQQFKNALLDTQGLNARLFIIAEFILEFSASRIGRLGVAIIALTIVWLLI